MQSQPSIWRSLFTRRRKSEQGKNAPSTADVVEHEADHEPVPTRGDAASGEDRLKKAAERNAGTKKRS